MQNRRGHGQATNRQVRGPTAGTLRSTDCRRRGRRAGAYFASSAPATSQLSAPITLWARSSTLAGRGITVSGRIVADPDLSGAVVRNYKREVGESSDTFVADATVSYDSMMSGNTSARSCPP